MKYVKLGNTGLDVSQLCLGCMSFGDAERAGDYSNYREHKVISFRKRGSSCFRRVEPGGNRFFRGTIYSP